MVGVYWVVGAILPAHREVARGATELSGHWPELAAEHLKYIEHVSQNIYMVHMTSRYPRVRKAPETSEAAWQGVVFWSNCCRRV